MPAASRQSPHKPSGAQHKATLPKGPASTSTPANSIATLISKRIARSARAKPGRVYTPFDFLDLGTPHSVGMVLTRMVRSGALRRLARGLYDVPRQHSVLGTLLPVTSRRNPATPIRHIPAT